MCPYYHLDLESAGDSTRVWVETEDYGIRVESRTHLRDVWMEFAYAIGPQSIVPNFFIKIISVPHSSDEISARDSVHRLRCLLYVVIVEKKKERSIDSNT